MIIHFNKNEAKMAMSGANQSDRSHRLITGLLLIELQKTLHHPYMHMSLTKVHIDIYHR